VPAAQAPRGAASARSAPARRAPPLRGRTRTTPDGRGARRSKISIYRSDVTLPRGWPLASGRAVPSLQSGLSRHHGVVQPIVGQAFVALYASVPKRCVLISPEREHSLVHPLGVEDS